MTDQVGWIEGVDVSNAQRPDACDWIKAAAAGLEFVWVKGSEGAKDSNPFVDASAREHIARIRKSPLAVGMYHVCRPDNRFRESDDGYANGVREGAFAAETAFDLGVVHDALPIWLDMEKYTDKGEVTTEQREDYTRGLVDTVERLTRVTPQIYSGPTYWGFQMSEALALEMRGRQVLLAMSNYQPNDVLDPSKKIDGWPWTFWQWSGGKQFAFADPWPGLTHPIDRNRFRGSLSEFRSLVT